MPTLKRSTILKRLYLPNSKKMKSPYALSLQKTTEHDYVCEVGILEGIEIEKYPHIDSIFKFSQRKSENTDRFNVMHLIPTGIGCEVGGHVDGGASARLLGQVCDTLITHPNVGNAADINELPENTLYVEGSIITRLIMGTIGLQPVKSNRVLIVSDKHSEDIMNHALINSVNAARACYGFNCPEIIMMDPPIKMNAILSASGRAVGDVEEINHVIDI